MGSVHLYRRTADLEVALRAYMEEASASAPQVWGHPAVAGPVDFCTMERAAE